MEEKTYTDSTETVQAAALVVTSEAVESVGAVAPETDGRVRRYLVAAWRFTRHLLEMVIAMMIGMEVFDLALEVVWQPAILADPLVGYGAMGVAMAAPMVAWMRYRGHSWLDGLEMTVAMLVPMFALVLPVEFGVERYVPGLTEHSLMMLSHVAMIAGMVALMIYRWDRYAHGPHSHRA